MSDRRHAARKKSFLQGRVYYNNQRSSVDCLVRDISEQGAKLVFADSVAIPDVVELHLPGKEEVRRVRLQWRKGEEIGVGFAAADETDDPKSDASPNCLFGRVLKLENECVVLKKTIAELRAQIRRLRSGETI
jgi:PilZ domain